MAMKCELPAMERDLFDLFYIAQHNSLSKISAANSPIRRSEVRIPERSKGFVFVPPQKRRSCSCSPTTHPGSFRCSLHRNGGSSSSSGYAPRPCFHLSVWRSAFANSIVLRGGMRGEWAKRALAATMIRPSSHQMRRRSSFQPKPSRLRNMILAEDAP